MSNVREIPTPTLEDISRCLREIADELDRGDFGRVTSCVVVVKNVEGDVSTFGLGGGNDLDRSIGLLMQGVRDLTG